MSTEGRERAAAAFHRRRLAGTGRPEYLLLSRFTAEVMEASLNEAAADGWRLQGHVMPEPSEGCYVATMTREVLPEVEP